MNRFLLIFLLFFQTRVIAEVPLRVGMELSYPPFEMVCNDGKPCGISVEMAYELGKFLHREIAIENIPFVGLLPALKNGSIDLIISSMTITEERKKSIEFSDPYVTTGLCLLISAKSPVKEVGDLNFPDRTVVVKSGTSGEVYASRYLSKSTVRVLDQEAMCVLEVVQGKGDAFIYDQLSTFRNWKKNPDTTRALLTPFQKESWGIGLSKNNPELLKKINAFIIQFRTTGQSEKLAEKYFLVEKVVFQEMGIPFIF